MSHPLVRVRTQTATAKEGASCSRSPIRPRRRSGTSSLSEEVRGQAIRLVPERRSDGQGGISLEAIDEPAPADAEAHAQGVRVVVAQELASTLDDAVLDAKPTEQGTEFFIRSQPANGSESTERAGRVAPRL